MAGRVTVTTGGGTTFSTTGRGSRTDLVGVENLEAAIRKLGEDMQGEILRDAVDAGAEIVRDVASQLAPRSTDGSHGHKPGFLAENIVTDRVWTKTQNTADTHVGMTKAAWYGRLQETGTVYQPAQPFLRPALDETKNDVVDAVAEHLRNAILRG
jgi:HK97 gp10 family phage protein